MSQIQNIKVVPVEEELKKSYIDYAMSVIVARALPDVRDGLKPVVRRILYAMYKDRILPDGSYKKSMGVVGEVLKKYHPHGDASVYDALARLAQDWVMRYPLIDGQGNFGSIDGDSPAAARYTEVRLAKITTKFLEGIESQTVNFVPNYTGDELEPSVLPTQIPNLLINGADGIAVGMATKIPPHNLTEIVDALIYLIDIYLKTVGVNYSFSQYIAKDYYTARDAQLSDMSIPYPDFVVDVTTTELMKYVKGPDFPTGAEFIDDGGLLQAYETGRGRIIMRAITKFEETTKGRVQIVVTELPYQVNKAKLAERIHDLLKEEKIDGISDIRDESNSKEGIRLVLELKKGINPHVLLNRLYRNSEMQLAFNINMVAIVDGEPHTLSLKKILELFLKHRIEIEIRSKLYEANQNVQREHIFEGLKKALDFIDEIIGIIRNSPNADIAKSNLMDRFGFTDVQAQAILDMQLRRLAALERAKVEEELNEVRNSLEQARIFLDSPNLILSYIKSNLENIKKQFGDERKTRIVKQDQNGQSDEFDLSLVEKKDVIVTISKAGYIRRVDIKEFKSQSRGGKGSVGAVTKKDDYVEHIIYCDTHSELILFSNKGKAYTLKVADIPEQQKKSKGTPVINFVSIDTNETITAVLVRQLNKEIIDEDQSQEGEIFDKTKFILMCTKRGIIKKIDKNEISEIRRNGINVINLDDGDELTFVRNIDEISDVIIVTKQARAVRFNSKSVRVMGRTARGITGIRLLNNDIVIMMDVIRINEDRILTVTENGYGKMTSLSEYPTKGRATKGMLAHKITPKTGYIKSARIIDHPDRDLLILSVQGKSIRINVKDIKESGRVTSGVILFKLDEDDRVASIAVI